MSSAEVSFHSRSGTILAHLKAFSERTNDLFDRDIANLTSDLLKGLSTGDSARCTDHNIKLSGRFIDAISRGLKVEGRAAKEKTVHAIRESAYRMFDTMEQIAQAQKSFPSIDSMKDFSFENRLAEIKQLIK
jgi:hypothetical protein